MIRRVCHCALALAMWSVMIAPATQAQPIVLTIELTEYRFSPDQLEVELGEEIRIHLINNGSEGHNFILETHANYDPIIAPGRQANVSFNADTVGTYLMYCTVSGHRALGMEGTFTISRVQTNPPTPVVEVVGLIVVAVIAAVAVVVLLRRRRGSEPQPP